jgi:glycosyltransferase involved in cell wall biosynthesis
VTGVTNPRPRVVACMPVWNAEHFIELTLDSLATQTYPNLHILISDDASTDATRAICQRFAERHGNCEYHRQPNNLGWLENVNALFKLAQGDYLFFAFHDDPLEPRYVERLVDALQHNPAAILAYTDIHVGDRQLSYTEVADVSDRFERARRIIHKTGHWWIPNRGLFRAQAVELTGGMRRHLGGEYSADWPWLLHLSLLGEFVRVAEPLVTKVFRDNGVSTQWNRNLSRLKSTAVIFACARVIRCTRLPFREEVRLQIELLRFFMDKLTGRSQL